jgi:hypothetical protein
VEDEFTICTRGKEAGSQAILGAISFAEGQLRGYSRFNKKADYLARRDFRAKPGVARIKYGDRIRNREGRFRIHLQKSRRCSACEHKHQKTCRHTNFGKRNA